MNDYIIRFYMLANKLKNILRQGWIEIGISKERTESVAEHVFGTLILALAIDSDYKLNLDMLKVFKMLALHETEEILMPDYTVRSNISKEEKLIRGRKCAHEVVNGLIDEQEINDLLDEFNAHVTKESKFCYLVDKIECDFQAKMYDLEGVMDYDIAREDLKYYGERKEEIDKNSKTASDIWIEYDRPKYEESSVFTSLLDDIKCIDEKVYRKTMNIKFKEE